MSKVPIKEEQEDLLTTAVGMKAEETAGEVQTYQPCNVLPTEQQTSVPAAICQADNDQPLQYVHPHPNMTLPSIVQGDAPMYQLITQPHYYTMADYSYQQLPPNPGPGHPQGVMGVMTTSNGSLVSRKSADESKRAHRLNKNRLAAKQSRARKKQYHEAIKLRLDHLEGENKKLREKLSYLTQGNNMYSSVPAFGGLPYVMQ